MAQKSLTARTTPRRQLPDNELFKAVQFSDGSNEAFLRRLWRDLYGDEPLDLGGPQR